MLTSWPEHSALAGQLVPVRWQIVPSSASLLLLIALIAAPFALPSGARLVIRRAAT
jgi:hypothetical protein